MRRPSTSILLLTALLATAGAAQPADEAALDRQRAALLLAKQASSAAATRAAAIEGQAAAARDAADRTREKMLAVAVRVRGAQADVAAADARIAIIAAMQRAQRRRLASRQGGLVRLTAALQIMARRPAALALVQPSSLADLAHVRVLLGAALPVVAQRTAGLRAELAAAERLSRQAEVAAAALRSSRYQLAARQLQLAQTEAGQRQQFTTLDTAAQDEAERALALGEHARDIVDEMQEAGTADDVRASLAALPDPTERPLGPGESHPGPPAARDRPRYLQPLTGSVATGFAEVSDAGVSSRGIAFATSRDEDVVAPRAGRVLYAARYRSYGFVLIVDHGGGWSTTFTGLGAIAIATGDRVRQGDRIGAAPDGPGQVTIELRRGGHPINLSALLGVG